MSSDRQQPESGMGSPGGPVWNVVWSYTILRFTLGTTFLLHGVTRLVSGWSAFADEMVQSFHDTFLPDFMVRPFALSVPPVEAVLGTLLCLGLFCLSLLILGLNHGRFPRHDVKLLRKLLDPFVLGLVDPEDPPLDAIVADLDLSEWACDTTGKPQVSGRKPLAAANGTVFALSRSGTNELSQRC